MTMLGARWQDRLHEEPWVFFAILLPPAGRFSSPLTIPISTNLCVPFPRRLSGISVSMAVADNLGRFLLTRRSWKGNKG